MAFSATKNSEFGDSYYDISKTEKRLIRATYEKTGTYVFLKLFKNVDDDYEIQQRLSLTTEEFDKNLLKKHQKLGKLFQSVHKKRNQNRRLTDLLLLNSSIKSHG